MDPYDEEFHRIVEPLAAEARQGRRMSPRQALFAACAMPAAVILALWAIVALVLRFV